MSAAAPELPVPANQTAFNVARWGEVCADPVLSQLEYRIETDSYGHIVMTPPPAPEHGELQVEIAVLLRKLLPGGNVITECPVSTDGGVRAADVAWISKARRLSQREKQLFTVAPEICVEVLSPSNTQGEIEEKKSLYFGAGAEEVWICGLDGTLRVFLRGAPTRLGSSTLCSKLPERVEKQ